MGILATLRIKFMLAWATLLRMCLSYPAGNRLASKTIHQLHPFTSRQKPIYLAGLNKVFTDNNKAVEAWRRHLALLGVHRFQSTFYTGENISWIKQCQLEVLGADVIKEAHLQGKGVLVMTYHHHFNMLFCNLLATLGLPTTTIAMDDRGGNGYRNFSKRVNRIYNHAERLLSGGDIILVKPQSQVRPILRAFEKNHLVITANDFPDVFDDKNRMDLPLLGTTLSCPTGTVKLAVKKNIPVVAAYLNWDGDDRFKLVIRKVSDSGEGMTVNTAMTCYLEVLATMIEEDPGLWEGWKWLGKPAE
jgi:lauroyl/myristoyl acyltransferase